MMRYARHLCRDGFPEAFESFIAASRPSARRYELRTSFIQYDRWMSHAERTSLHDVARAAGVSLATVDRVLHGRAGVRARTAELVQSVVERLGYRPDPSAARLARKSRARLMFILPSGT